MGFPVGKSGQVDYSMGQGVEVGILVSSELGFL